MKITLKQNITIILFLALFGESVIILLQKMFKMFFLSHRPTVIDCSRIWTCILRFTLPAFIKNVKIYQKTNTLIYSIKYDCHKRMSRKNDLHSQM